VSASHRLRQRLTGKGCGSLRAARADVATIIEHREADGGDLRYRGHRVVALHWLSVATAPSVTFRHDGYGTTSCKLRRRGGLRRLPRRLPRSIPAAFASANVRDADPFAWLGLLADAEPAIEELVYCSHDHGFALYSYAVPHHRVAACILQVACSDEQIRRLADERIWDELDLRFERRDDSIITSVGRGVLSIEKSCDADALVRVGADCKHGRLSSPADDRAHIVPPRASKA